MQQNSTNLTTLLCHLLYAVFEWNCICQFRSPLRSLAVVHLNIQQVIVLGPVAGIMVSVGHVMLQTNSQHILVIRDVQDFTALITSQVKLTSFYAQQQLLLQRLLTIAIVFVCQSHGWVSQKRCQLGLPNFHPRLPGGLYFQEP